MACYYLVRHGYTDMVDRVIAGRMRDVHLNAHGRAQADELSFRFGDIRLDAVCSSPLERAMETAGPISHARSVEVRIFPEFTEVDYGDWTGREVAQLSGERWERFNAFRGGTRIPGGETMLEVQNRMIAGMETLANEQPEGVFLIVSHADPIKSVVAHFAGIPLDFFLRLEISPASVSAVLWERWGPRILAVNVTGAIPFFRREN